MRTIDDFMNNDGYHTRLVCPSCGEDYTHNIGVESIRRDKEDSPRGTRVVVRSNNVSLSQDAETNNPSRRRSAVVLRFSCEQGCDDFTLSFSQHKGQTLVECCVLKGQGCSDDNDLA